MGRTKNKNTIEVCEGVYLKSQGNSDKLHYYFTLDGFQHRKSTKTKDVTEAKRIALNAYADAKNRKHSGKNSQKISFKRLAKKYVESLQGKKKQKFHRETMRVDEIKTVTWRDIDLENKTIKLWTAGKKDSSRLVIIRWEYGIKALKRIKERRLEYLKKENRQFNEKEHIQSIPNGEKVSSLTKGFNSLLKECGFQYANIEEKHSLTSLRHSYATNKLTSRYGRKASSKALAKQMGTSVKMIEKHYGHDVAEDYYDELAD